MDWKYPIVVNIKLIKPMAKTKTDNVEIHTSTYKQPR